MPGNPAPDPRSAQTLAWGAKSRSWSESAIWRVQITGIVDGAIKVCVLLPGEQQLDEAIEPFRCFT